MPKPCRSGSTLRSWSLWFCVPIYGAIVALLCAVLCAVPAARASVRAASPAAEPLVRAPEASHAPEADPLPPAAATLSGTVIDPTGAKVPNATVHIETTHSGTSAIVRDLKTGNDGRYSITLPAGTYDVTILAPGFDPFISTITVGARSTSANLDAKLAIATEAETVTVAADNQQGSTSAADNKSALIFKDSDLKTFSDDDTTFQQEIQSLAGGSGQGGADLYVDGFSGGRFPPKSTIREIRINQNPYSPQFDGLGFNRVEIFTKPGGNTLHGSIFISGNDNAFNARNPYTTVLPPGDSLLIQAEVSGALNKKTSFALSSNYVNQQSAAIVNAPTSLDTNGNPVVLTQTVSSPTNTSNYTLRLDRQVTPANTFFSRYEYNSSTLTNSGVGLLVLASEGISTTTTQQTLQLGDTQSLGKNIVAETRFQYQRIRLDQTPNSTAPAIIVEGGFSGGGSPAGGLTDNQDHYEFQEYLSVSHGAHFIRAGGRYRLFRESNDSTANYNGTFTYNSLASYLATPNNTGASQFSITQGQSSAVLLTGDLGLYAEDEWKLRKNVTVNLGLRFETQSAIPDHSDPAPRIGASWAVGQTDKRKPFVVLRAGTGIFYQRFTAANLLTSVRQNGVSQQTYFVTNPAGDPTSLPPSSSYASTPPTPYTVSPNLRSSYEIISGLTAERSLGKYGQFTVNYLAIRGDHQFNSFNINAPLPDGTRPLGGTQNRYQFASEGIEKAQTVFANTNLNLTSKLHLFAFYIYRHQNGNTAGATSFASQPYNLKADYGPASGGFRANGQRLFTGSYAELPFGFTYDMFLSAQNGQPFNITTGTDLNGDTVYNDRPAFATDLSRASVVRSKYGNFDTQPIAGQTIIPYNDATSPGLFFMELGVSRNFKFGPRPAAEPLPPDAPAPQGKVPLPDPKYRLVFEVDASNVLNHVNPGVPVSVLSSPEFGQSISQNPFFSQNNAANRVILLMTSFHF